MPGVLGILVPWVLSLAVCTVLAGRALSLLRLSLAVMVSQALFHTLFVLGAAPGPSAEIATGHVHTVVLPAALPAAPAAMDLAMLFAHAAAAAVTVFALYRGERAVGALLVLAADYRAWLRRRAAAVDSPLVLVIRMPQAPAVYTSRAPRSWLMQSSLRWRGPPTLAVV